MLIFWIILIVIAAYFVAVFILLRLVVPFMSFRKYAVPAQLPQEVREAITSLENKSADQMSYLKAVYDFVMEKNSHQWKHVRFQSAFRLPRLFVGDLKEIWNSNDFVFCTGINYVVYVLLANSKFFTAEDVKIKHTFLNFVPHQYLRVNVGGKPVDVDPAGAGVRGRPFGAHMSLFG